MKKWEYKVEDMYKSNCDILLKHLGEEGWELVSIIDSLFPIVTAIFKREKQ